MLTIEVCRLLIEAGGHVGERNRNGMPPLLLTAFFGDTVMCEVLLEQGKVNIEETELGGNTPMRPASMKGYASIVALLL